MDNTTRRPWEDERTSAPYPPNPAPLTLPGISSLTANMDTSPIKAPLNQSFNEAQRDSGNWSMPQSSRSSAHSNTMPYLNSAHHSPTRLTGYTHEPASSGQQSQVLPPMNTTQPDPHRGSGDYQDSRRSSVDSRIDHRMARLDMSQNSPYTSNNPSQTSLATGLQRERGIQPANGSYRGPRYSTSSGGPLSPVGYRASDGRGFKSSRIAPPIAENPNPHYANALEPTVGQAYAFPDPDAPPRAAPTSHFSRRSSFANSYATSVLSVDSDMSRLPDGQQELPGDTHHHSLQPRQVTDLMDDPDSPDSTTPYSRTPELRVTHKLAERKRRSEMKDCFEDLRRKLPPNQNNKSSKWETLTRAIDYIDGLQRQLHKDDKMIKDQSQHIDRLDAQIKDLTQQVQRGQRPASYQTPPSASSHSHSPLGFSNHYGNGDAGAEPPRTLPPLMNGAMQGVQYNDDRR